MPIVFKKHFGDSDDDTKDNENMGIDSFLNDDDNDNGNVIKQPPTKKRKLNTSKSRSIHKGSSIKKNKNKNKKSKSMLKRERIKRTKQKKRLRNDINGTDENNMKSRKKSVNNSRPSFESMSFESMSASKQAIEFQKLFLQTLKTTTKQLGIQFKPSHFIQISRHDIDPINNDTSIGSLDVLHDFLNKYYQIESNDDNENNKNENNKNENDDKQISKNDKNKKEWIAYTKSMQLLIISPSVRKAVDTIKSLSKIRVKHSFIHKKQLQAMTQEEYDQYIENEPELSIIPLRICELFGKHRKIDYQENELLNKSWHCGVGGINRINKLCKSKHLTLKKCQLIIIDLQQNVKCQSILDSKQICQELCQWFKQYAFTRISNKNLKIAFI